MTNGFSVRPAPFSPRHCSRDENCNPLRRSLPSVCSLRHIVGEGSVGPCRTVAVSLSLCRFWWNSESELFDGACFGPSATVGPDATLGDFGYCVPTCSCSEDCNSEALGCGLLSIGELPATFRGPGLCFSGIEPADQIDLCGGGGGSGGAPNDSGGAPNGNGGAGGAP